MNYSSPIVILFRFGKDICAVVLLLIELLSANKSKRASIFLAMIAIICYGTIIALLNNYPIYTLVSGYRSIIYFGALCMYFGTNKKKDISVKRFLEISTILLVLNTVIAAVQAYDCLGTNLALIGQGSYRFMGLFPAAAAFAYYCFGTALLACIIETFTKDYHKECIFIIIVAFLGCYISGTRSSMLNLLAVIYIYIIDQARMKASQKLFVSLVLTVPALPLFIGFSSRMANRGSILQNATTGGRFTVFLNSVINQSFTSFVFGNGIGAGSNSAAEFAFRSQTDNFLILDGTFTTIIYQFGLIGFFFCVYILWYVARRVNESKGPLYSALFVFTIILQGLTCNVLEAFALLIMLFICFFTLINGENVFRELSFENNR